MSIVIFKLDAKVVQYVVLKVIEDKAKKTYIWTFKNSLKDDEDNNRAGTDDTKTIMAYDKNKSELIKSMLY